jgi:hypothetical protein
MACLIHVVEDAVAKSKWFRLLMPRLGPRFANCLVVATCLAPVRNTEEHPHVLPPIG